MAYRDQAGNIIVDGNTAGLVCGLAIHLNDDLITQIRAAFLDAPEASDKAEVGIFYNDKIALLTFDDFLSRIFPINDAADTPETTNKRAVKAA